ncbi:hypothetical protein AC481_03225 [miscellaneous Crenarchaeota group archaeon SMTZ-80]|nr:MAG: hypothetical protein AC481_03225 [miscellaneous Crenarchaeota group archaeon SMTZ-80]
MKNSEKNNEVGIKYFNYNAWIFSIARVKLHFFSKCYKIQYWIDEHLFPIIIFNLNFMQF